MADCMVNFLPCWVGSIVQYFPPNPGFRAPTYVIPGPLKQPCSYIFLVGAGLRLRRFRGSLNFFDCQGTSYTKFTLNTVYSWPGLHKIEWFCFMLYYFLLYSYMCYARIIHVGCIFDLTYRLIYRDTGRTAYAYSCTKFRTLSSTKF
jgi:hypothetical protein